jgi:hypothetical protein
MAAPAAPPPSPEAIAEAATPREPSGPAERAATGSEFILPANPLSELSDAGLHGLIECVIYEDSGVPRETLDEQDVPADERETLEPPVAAPHDAPWASAAPEPLRAATVSEPLPAPPVMGPMPELPASPALSGGGMRPVASARGYVVTAALAGGLAFFAAYLIFADRGSPSPDLEPSIAAEPSADPSADSALLADASSLDPSLDERLAEHEGVGDDEGIEDEEELAIAEHEEVHEEEPPDEELALAGEDLAQGDDGAACIAHIDSTPPGARVIIDGETVGPTPITDLEVECGVELAVAVARRGFVAHRQRVTASPDAPLELRASLEPAMTQLRVVTRPSGATVAINGNVVGTSPVSARVRQATRVQVTVSLRGHRVWSRQIRPQRDRITLRAELDRILP